MSEDIRDKRLRSSVLIEVDDSVFVIDAGPDFRQQMLKYNVKRLDAIILTHGHKDHTGGIDDVRAFNFKQNRPMDIYGDRKTISHLKKEYFYVFNNDYPGIPKLSLHRIQNKKFNINGIEFIPIRIKHGEINIFGYRIGKFVYLTDLNYISGREKKKLVGADVLVISALRKTPHKYHLSLAEALLIIDEVKPKRAYITHVSHLMGLYSDLENELPSYVKCAYDGLVIDL